MLVMKLNIFPKSLFDKDRYLPTYSSLDFIIKHYGIDLFKDFFRANQTVSSVVKNFATICG